MKALLYKVLLLTLCSCLDILRLDTSGKPSEAKLTPGTFIVSTFGIFRATLDKVGCGITVQQFNNLTNLYQFKGRHFSENVKKNCNQLRIMPGELQTQSGDRYMFAQNLAYNLSTIFTIDDLGVMRLISTFILNTLMGYNSTEFVIRTFETPNKYIGSYSEFNYSFQNPMFSIINERKWNFTVNIGAIIISMLDNENQQVQYTYNAITIKNSSIYDFNLKYFPAVMFTNISLEPRCNQPQKYLNFKPPFVIYADPYWPAGGFYDQGGYKLFQLAYSKLPQSIENQNISEINYHRFFSHCPRRTFEYRGDCLGICPLPYYHLIKGQSGFCVLRCQQNSSVNQQKRICGCVTDYQFDKLSLAKLVTPCPSKSTQTPYGCQCDADGFFFDGKYSFSCVQNCPNGTFGINKICMGCPDQCLTCKKDTLYRIFLQCIECKPGFVKHKGQCIQSCHSSIANYNAQNKTCSACLNPNCTKCSTHIYVCQQCNLMNTLFNGDCLNICPPSPGLQQAYGYVYSKGFDSVCLPKNDGNCTKYIAVDYKGESFLKCEACLNQMFAHLDGCVIQCPKGYQPHKKYCVCEGNKLTVLNKCMNIPGCPIGMSFNITSYSCINCPFGCMTCVDDMCTSCNPGYFLFISFLAVNCRKKNPFNGCEKDFSWQQDSCIPTDYKKPEYMMTSCLSSINNCKVCNPLLENTCALCMEGYLLHNETCINQCPAGLLKYMQTCILPQIQNCSVPHLLSLHKAGIFEFSNMQKNSSYAYYTYDLNQRPNDPAGNIIFQQSLQEKLLNVPTQTSFFQPSWICLKCNDGYGLDEDFVRCLPCPKQCYYKLCYMARKDSCLGPPKKECGIHQYIDEQTNACLQSCNSSNKFPEIRHGKLYCVISSKSSTKDFIRIDASTYRMRNGQFCSFFVFSHKMNPDIKTVKVQSFSQVLRNFPTNKSTDKLADNSTNNSIIPTQIPNDQIIGDIPSSVTSSPVVQQIIRDNQYVAVQRTEYPAHLMNLEDKILELPANSDVAFPSKVYGTVYLADHTEFMKTWLAYIGYVMAIVIILLHAVFIGNQLLYKVDNLLIFAQTIFYFSFVQNLVGRLLAQYYFGWSFAHARFLPNLFSQTIPDHYVQLKAPISYKLVNMDGNYFRNAGFSLAWVLIYIICWGIISFFVWAVVSRMLKKFQAWYPKICTQALIAGIQFFSMNLMFFSVSQLAYNGDAYLNGFQDYYDRSNTLATITIIVLCAYTFVRFFFNPIGGLYMVKRIIIAVLLVYGFEINLMILPLIVLQLLFAFIRYIIQQPIMKFQKITIWAESILFIACYLLLFFCVDAGVNTIIISILIFIFIVYLAYDLINLYLQSRNQYPEQQLMKEYQELASEINKQRARTVMYINGDKRNEHNSKGPMSLVAYSLPSQKQLQEKNYDR